ncbi:cytochrome P450 [Collybia nuda]|uniref:Cytochrome P450 n=1 Tax=Collybia nuda TaxID=64659 RepID=A0A9P6CC15_9AGAR|nr:cytochrome P450 [Collybia nuda]
MISYTHLLLIGFLALILLVWRGCSKKTLSFPPGPPAYPIIGHLHCMPSRDQEEIFCQWAQKYGDVIHLRVPGRSIVVLNSDKAATDLLEKRGSIYSCRPQFTVLSIMGWGQTLAFLPYGKRFLRHRKIISQPLGRHESTRCHPSQLKEARVLLRTFMQKPGGGYEAALHRFATGVVVHMSFGHKITSDNDLYLRLARDSTFATDNSGTPGNTVIDLLPTLQYFPDWFPGTYYAGWARSWNPTVKKIHDHPYETIMSERAEGKSNISIVGREIEKMLQDGNGAEDAERVSDIKGSGAILFAAGVDSVSATLTLFLLLMLLHPDCQRKAQEEIDLVLKGERLPNFYDRTALPYVGALVQEILRWHPTVPLGLPHRLLEDDVYRGMFIPKGSIVFANARGVSLDENVYHDPHRFHPERFLPGPAGLGEPFLNAAFGYGRRECPGRHVAETSLWIAVVSILAVFSIESTVPPKMEFSVGLAHRPVQFECTFRDRLRRGQELILDDE